jgi:hypothetical protein
VKTLGAVVLVGLLIIPMSCYIVNTEKGTSRVMLAQSFPAGVTALHAAVFQGTSAEENLLAYQIFYPGQSVNMSVPGGAARIFVVWGEGSTPGIATYYGTAGPTDVASDGDIEVPVIMQAITTALVNVRYDPDYWKSTWNHLQGATDYNLQYYYDASPVFRTVYLGPYIAYYYSGPPPSSVDVRIKATSSIFNLSTVFIDNL